MQFSVKTIHTQDQALRELARLVDKSIAEDPRVRIAALKIVNSVQSRDDLGELDAIYRAVKHGNAAVPALRYGFAYRADPTALDWYASATRNLELCEGGACGGDCDDHAQLCAALAGSLGFATGLRAYAKPGHEEYSHIYAVARVPKRAPETGRDVGMDTTVPGASLGWEPPPGRYRTIWVTR